MQQDTNLCLLLAKARPVHVSSIARIEKNIQHIPWSKSAISEAISSPDRHTYFWIATSKDLLTPLGYLCFRLLFDEIYVMNLGVHEAYQKKGIGSFLIKNLIFFSKRRRIKRIVLDVLKKNLGAMEFYKKFGFEFSAGADRTKGNYLIMEFRLRGKGK